MTATLSGALQSCAWMAARETNGLNADNVGLAVAVAARLADAGIVSLEQLDLLLDRQPQQEDANEPAPDDDAARDRMERSKQISPYYIDPDGTRWDVVESARPGFQHKQEHDWSALTRSDDDRERRACGLCGLIMVKAQMQT